VKFDVKEDYYLFRILRLLFIAVLQISTFYLLKFKFFI